MHRRDGSSSIGWTGAVVLGTAVLLLFFVVPSAFAGQPKAVVFTEDFDSLAPFLWDVDFQSAGSPSAGTASVFDGVFSMRPAVSGARSALHAKFPANMSLPATVRFKVRFPAGTYRSASFRLMGSYDDAASFANPVVTWRMGATGSGAASSVSIGRGRGRSATVVDGAQVLPSDMWLEGEMRIFADKVVALLDGTTVEAAGDVETEMWNWSGLYPAFEVTDDAGAKGIEIDYLVIEQGAVEPPAEPENVAPTAAAGPDRTALVGLAVIFDGSASYDPDGSIASYAWEFGDGSTAASVVATHTYTTAGTYTARLTVTDDKGATGVDEALVRVITPETSIQELKGDVVRSLPTPPYPRGVRQRLLVTLNSALRAYRARNYVRSIQMMRVFSTKVRVLRGKKYPHDMAARWLGWSAEIQASLRTMQARKGRK
jgi:chitodextrinase